MVIVIGSVADMATLLQNCNRILSKARPLLAISSRGLADVSAKRHYERRLLQYSPEELYDVVSNVAQYQEFVPWCKESTVLSSSDKEMKAELVVGFGYFTEKYLSIVSLEKPITVVAVSDELSLFEFLKTEWKFSPASNPNHTWVSFRVDFKFKSALYNNISELFLKEVVNNMVKAFQQRCKKVYNK